jgi:hypothetical protein
MRNGVEGDKKWSQRAENQVKEDQNIWVIVPGEGKDINSRLENGLDRGVKRGGKQK